MRVLSFQKHSMDSGLRFQYFAFGEWFAQSSSESDFQFVIELRAVAEAAELVSMLETRAP